MRDYRLPAGLSLLAAGLLAGCVTTGSPEATPEDTKTIEENRQATAATERKPEPAPERTTATTARSARETTEPDRSAPLAARESVRTEDANSPLRLVAQLNEATREIASLRAANAKLRAAPPTSVGAPSAREPDSADAKLAANVKSYAQFKNDLATMFAEVEKLRAENASLTAQLKDASSGSRDVKATIAKLESELKAEKSFAAKLETELKTEKTAAARLDADLKVEKTARTQAEQATAKLREQLRAVASAAVSGLEPSGGSTSESRTRSGSASTRRHVLRDGETLEKLAERYYGDPAKWRTILDANRSRLPLDGTLPSGMELEIPAK
jgi:nucleoid-associated protein YgaU